jgi:hypothetical protein
LHKKGADRPSVDADTVDRVSEACEDSAGKSIRRANTEILIAWTAMQKFLHRRLKLHEFRTHTVQAMELDDRPCQKELAVDCSIGLTLITAS